MLLKSRIPLLSSQLPRFAKPRIQSMPQNKTGQGWQAGQLLLHSPCAEQSRVYSQLPAGFFLQIPGEVASGCPQASCFPPAPVEGSASETLRQKKKKKKKEEDQLFIWDGNKAGERMDVFSFALRLENSRKPLLEEKAHGHQYDLCRLCCLEVGLQTGFCGG